MDVDSGLDRRDLLKNAAATEPLAASEEASRPL